ncbi:TSSK6-activating co-chaperone protein isoform X1 [Pantherophis guttatus]|uniref:TSSK6-activating co-chaperone protein isoform X1 n=2 Tax=Pantherophis guttatus TaxID=94885 RepID=A0A6P9CUI2_PANGU|nr:TSSK6-activating co-chaperone protein isoform X1 [Pantherophis guttatus]
MRPSRRPLQFLPRFVSGRPHPRGMSSSPVQMEPDLNPQEEKQHRKSASRRSSQVPREDLDGPPATSFKPLCPAKPSPSFLELPSTQWRPNPLLPHSGASRTGKGKRHFSPDHEPQECFGLLECLHNNMQVQTQIAQEQLALLQDIRESMNLLVSQQDQQNGELRGQLGQHIPRDPASSPHPGS